MSLKLAVLRRIHFNQTGTRSVEPTVVLHDRWPAVWREITDLLDCHAHILLKINRVEYVIAVEAPAHVLLVGNRRPLIEVGVFALTPRRSDIIFGARPAQGRELLITVKINFDLPLAPPHSEISLLVDNDATFTPR